MTTTISKNLINDVFVISSGDTMTGDLTIQYGTDPSVILQPDTPSGAPSYTIKDLTSTTRAQFLFNEATGDVIVQRKSAGGVIETTLILTSNGNVTLGGTGSPVIAPTELFHLTTKQYVDDEISTSGGGATTLNDLTDVTNTTPSDKDILIYDGITDNKYENRALVEADISDLGTEIVTKTEIAALAGNITMNGGNY